MKIIVIHGDNEVMARARLENLLSEARLKGFNIQQIALKDALFEKGLSSQGLFGENLIVVENPVKLSNHDLTILFKSKENIENLIFFNSGFLSKNFLGIIPKGSEIEEFKLPKTIYKFLDSFYPKNSKIALNLLEVISKKEPQELILHLLSKFLYDLYLTKLNPKLLNYPEWRLIKLIRTSEKFSQSKLKVLIKKLAAIDVRLKTSKGDLISSLDLVIATELE